MSSICFPVVLIFVVINFILINSEKALLFDVEENLLVEKEKSIFKGINKAVCQKCAAACPANTSEEIIVGRRAMVVQKVYGGSAKMDEIVLPECDKTIEAAFFINNKLDFVETGYKIYDLNNIIEPSQLKSENKDFSSMYPSEVSEIVNPDENIPPSDENAESFIWIPVLSINFNMKTMSPKQIEYHTDSGIHQPRGDCHTFDVGKEYYENNSDSIPYFHENQRLIFTGKKDLPDPLPKGESQCGQKYGCLIKHQVIPSYYMHSYAGALATCTPMNTVPIWDSITEQVNVVDRYLYAMIQIWKSNMRLKNGVFEILKPRKTHFKKIPISREELYLDKPNKKIPVPMIFYKMVEYRVDNPAPQERTDYYPYSTIVVIHNNPTSDARKQRLCKEKNTVSGWEDIQKTESEFGLTYVCAVTEDIAEKLGLFIGDVVKDRKPLKLDDFPIYDSQKRKYLLENKKFEISEKVKELFLK